MPPFTAVDKPPQAFRNLFGVSGNDSKDGKPPLPCMQALEQGETDCSEKRQDKQCEEDMNVKNTGEKPYRKRVQLLFYQNEIQIGSQPGCENHRRQI
ncbi:hypothetical protein T458_16565 [Brevibacillus panacihumi W25]|uniref:Uncharacterized protein n=1 Tax=Brevibacillus panacihumi W25 TaxID=1408254 RepID=V6MEK7_9BACL|nr:hypothetical protein T458_16565 [Brevibacillus panacihumi W25]